MELSDVINIVGITAYTLLTIFFLLKEFQVVFLELTIG